MNSQKTVQVAMLHFLSPVGRFLLLLIFGVFVDGASARGVSLHPLTDSVTQIQLEHLSCMDIKDRIVLGLDITSPTLGWQIQSGLRDVKQTSYQIQVASSLEKLKSGRPDYWDSQKIMSDSSQQVVYKGRELTSRAALYWRVRIWTNKGNTGWSQASSWTMGLLRPGDWHAEWIGWDHPFAWDSVQKFSKLSARYLRKEFRIQKKIKSATAFISGLGLYELYINGQKAGKAVLSPDPTDYSKRVLYNTLDVTRLLKKGSNAIGVILGNGRYFTMRQDYKPWKWHQFGFPKLCMQLEITYTDGSSQTVLTDNSWQLSGEGPIRFNNEYDGEIYDATRALTNWNQPSYNAGAPKWQSPEVVAGPGGQWQSQLNAPMEVMDSLTPREIRDKGHGCFILDMGQNMAGWLRMNVNGKGHRGDTVRLRFAESLTPGGELYTANLRDAKSTDYYIIKGDTAENWAPRFVYHGFRYVEVNNYPGTAKRGDFTGEVVYDAMEQTGSFACSDSTLNQIYKNAIWSIKSNYKGMPVDCPQRNERQPWLGDRKTGAYGESFVMDNHQLYRKWLQDIEDAQLPTGSLPDVAPNFWFYYKDDVTWPSTYLSVAAMLYHQYGDLQPIQKHYSSMKFWVEYMNHNYVKKGLISKDSYGDWCVPPDSLKEIHSSNPVKVTNGTLIATASFYQDMEWMHDFAIRTGNDKDTALYDQIGRDLRQAFQQTFFQQYLGYYGNNTVTANLLALCNGLVPKGQEEKVFYHISDKIEGENNTHISTGVIGTGWLMRTLTRHGRNDLAVRLATTRTYPGWGYMVANGATTIWELWNGNTANPAMNSQNHVMLLGDLLIWLYEQEAGIASQIENTGFKKIVMAPKINGDLKFVKASYQSPYGLITSHWEKSASVNTWSWIVSIPSNTSAELQFPAQLDPSSIEENMRSCGLKSTGEGKAAVLQVGSGSYHFTGHLKKNERQSDR